MAAGIVRHQTDPKKLEREDPLRFYNPVQKKKGSGKAVMGALTDTVFFS